ncbi:hypothetical protein EJ08DRAFT_321674 [Tothia fuscella]|uniref:SnoaL-like domain-containing protein n=1 Tax=Tothia fuscella TaxID=1048955 RepID=A0A9P4TVW2_9PEZI|nr:hypothetical protein EJ08DRAFT_321674 [Tothia fuscella]
MADIWPSSPITVSDQVKQAITRFFQIGDSSDPGSGKLFADELFTKDGIFKTHKTLVFRGYEEIAAARESKNPITESREHELVQVFAANSPATDLAVFGHFKITLKERTVIQFDFTARFIVAPERGEEVKFEFVEVRTDGTEYKHIFDEVSQKLASEKS